MSRGIILYQSKYGATKKYVDWLVEELGYDYAETKNSKVVNTDESVHTARSLSAWLPANRAQLYFAFHISGFMSMAWPLAA